MKIIVGTDFSKSARAAGTAAAALVRRWNGTLLVAHVFDDLASGRLPSDIRATLAASTNDRLHDEAVHLGSEGLKVEEHMLSGAPEKELADLAVRSEARLVVVSSVGRRPGEWLLGSVAERTAEFCPVPTLVVRDADPLSAWAAGDKPLKVFVAVDFSSASDKALKWVKHLMDAGPCEVVLGYVDWPLGERSRLGLGWDPLEHRNPPEVQHILRRELRERAEAVLGTVNLNVRSDPSLGRPDIRLVEMACEEKADLLVTATHQRRGVSRLWHPSISRALLRYAPMSVLCVPVIFAEAAPQHSAPIRRVLVAVDLSEHGGRAVPYAYGIVNSGGVVRLLHVMTPMPTPNPLIGGYPHPDIPSRKEQARTLAEAKNSLNFLACEDAASRGIVTETTVVEAQDVAKAIRQAAERFGADVICVGAHNRSGLSQAFVGSVAQAVIVQSGRPVLVVHEQQP